MKFSFFVLVLLGLSAIALSANTRPTIGILTELEGQDKSFIVASYVKWIESAGGRAVPFMFERWDKETLLKMLRSVNGVLFPGGSVKIEGKYLESIVTIAQYAIAANDNDDYFPLWGTCLGFFEVMIGVINNTGIINCGFDSEDLALALELTPAANASKFFNAMPENLRKIITTEKVTYNNHGCAVTPDRFNQNPKLVSFFDVLSTNVDKQGRAFISTIEAKKYPFFGAQWHPEKAMFEWKVDSEIDHSYDSVELNSWTSRFFVNECRKNFHKFGDAETEKKSLIYQYTPTYTGDNSLFMQKYYFPIPKN